MDTTGADLAPVETDWAFSGLFFISWLVVGNFMALNLFVGAIVDNFRTIRKQVGCTLPPIGSQMTSLLTTPCGHPHTDAHLPYTCLVW